MLKTYLRNLEDMSKDLNSPEGKKIISFQLFVDSICLVWGGKGWKKDPVTLLIEVFGEGGNKHT